MRDSEALGRRAVLAWAAIATISTAAAVRGAVAAERPAISGDYMEARTADVYTGPCFANSEMNLVGKQAVMAWRVRQGSWQGVPLGGLSVVAAVRATATLGDPFGGPLHAKALVVVDQRASGEQKEALIAFARAASGGLLDSVVGVESAPIELDLMAQGAPRAASPDGATAADPHAMHHHGGGALPAVAGISGEAHLRAGSWIDLDTRAIGPQDHLCGNEEVYYPPLSGGAATITAIPAVTVEYDFRGPGLGMVWSSPGKRSAYVGHFQG